MVYANKSLPQRFPSNQRESPVGEDLKQRMGQRVSMIYVKKQGVDLAPCHTMRE